MRKNISKIIRRKIKLRQIACVIKLNMKTTKPIATAEATVVTTTIMIPEASRLHDILQTTLHGWIKQKFITSTQTDDGIHHINNLDLIYFLVTKKDESNKIPVVEILLNDIPDCSDLQPRVGTDPKVVERYVYDLNNGAKFPPITVVELDGVLAICDGFHRYKAYKDAGFASIPARVVKYITQNEAFLLSIRLNKKNALQFSDKDLIHMVRKALQRPGIKELNYQQIADLIACSVKTVQRASIDEGLHHPKSRPGATRKHAIRNIEQNVLKLLPTDPDEAKELLEKITQLKMKEIATS